MPQPSFTRSAKATSIQQYQVCLSPVAGWEISSYIPERTSLEGKLLFGTRQFEASSTVASFRQQQHKESAVSSFKSTNMIYPSVMDPRIPSLLQSLFQATSNTHGDHSSSRASAVCHMQRSTTERTPAPLTAAAAAAAAAAGAAVAVTVIVWPT